MSWQLPRVLCVMSLSMLSLSGAPAEASGSCKAEKTDLPVALSGMQPTITAQINGQDAKFILDSGAFYSMISAATAAQFNLRLTAAPYGLDVRGFGGAIQTKVTTVKDFTLAGILLHNREFLVGGGEVGGDSVGLLGQNFLEIFDVEYDLANGIIRLFRFEGCKNAMLAYWVRPGQPYSVLDIESTSPLQPHTIASVYLNGKKIRAMFDTGAQTSVLSLKAAKQAGVDLTTPGVEKAGSWGGLGRGRIDSYVAPFGSFKLGDSEEIKNARLRIAETGMSEADMWIGADFFLSHRLLVANSQHRMYVTYNGGAVFNLGRTPIEVSSAETKKNQDELADAAAFVRRGEAFADRRDFEHALADLSRACELEPSEAEYVYQRGRVYLADNQPQPAAADFDRALILKPDLVPALIARAEMRLGSTDLSGAIADLDAAAGSAPKQADSRFTLAELYEDANQSQSAIAQVDLWIASHPDDSKMVDALNMSCWVRTMQGTELRKALDDCDKAVSRGDRRNSEGYADLLNSRGFAQLRRGEFDKAISDFNTSLKFDPKMASTLYGRGIAKLRKLKTADGQADIAAATALSPRVGDYFDRHGIAQ